MFSGAPLSVLTNWNTVKTPSNCYQSVLPQKLKDLKPLHQILTALVLKEILVKVLLIGGSYGKMGAIQLPAKVHCEQELAW